MGHGIVPFIFLEFMSLYDLINGSREFGIDSIRNACLFALIGQIAVIMSNLLIKKLSVRKATMLVGILLMIVSVALLAYGSRVEPSVVFVYWTCLPFAFFATWMIVGSQ